ncbi:MAG: hypothetical protein ACYCPO_15450, partial [Acidobacteriaceae bacterium]
ASHLYRSSSGMSFAKQHPKESTGWLASTRRSATSTELYGLNLRFPFPLHISQQICMALSGHTVSPCYRAKMAAHQPFFICAGLVFVKT